MSPTKMWLLVLVSMLLSWVGPAYAGDDDSKKDINKFQLALGLAAGVAGLYGDNPDSASSRLEKDLFFNWGLTGGVVLFERLKIDAEYLRMPDVMDFRYSDTNLVNLNLSYRFWRHVLAPYLGVNVGAGYVHARDDTSQRGSYLLGPVHLGVLGGLDFLVSDLFVLFVEGRYSAAVPRNGLAHGWRALAGLRFELF